MATRLGGGGGAPRHPLHRHRLDIAGEEHAQGRAERAASQNPRIKIYIYIMYIKFCRSFGEDKKDDTKDNLASQLTVELDEGKGKQTEVSARPYRTACFVLALLCLVLLLVVLVLGVKLQTGSGTCAHSEDAQIELAHGCHRCADGWRSFGRHCFYLSTFRKSWDQSQVNCAQRGGSLAIISSLGVQKFLATEGNLKYWIGLRGRGNTWSWVNNTALQQSYWAENPLEGDCGVLSGKDQPEKNWLKAPCQTVTYFICQISM